MYVCMYLRSAALPHDGDERWSKSQRLLEAAFQQYALLECIVVGVLTEVLADMTALLLIARTLSTDRHHSSTPQPARRPQTDIQHTALHRATSTPSTDGHSTHGSTPRNQHAVHRRTFNTRLSTPRNQHAVHRQTFNTALYWA